MTSQFNIAGYKGNPMWCTRLLYVICYMLYVIRYMLYVICYMLYVICYTLYVICYMLRKQFIEVIN